MSNATGNSLDDLKRVIERHWGFRTFKPLQERAMQAVLSGRDSLVVLPTGGGKSLCYQAPAVLRGDTTVVVSPLIALMKDQVDGLHACGVPAIQIDSSQSPEERYHYEKDIADAALRLVFISPERLVGTDFFQLLRRIKVRTFAIDEAHCISHWGHDFRPEYRQLRRIKELFPEAAIHAYTATATEQVRRDIVEQVALKQPEVLVGNFDRPNLNYRVLPRHDLIKQVLDVLQRHRGEAGIIYCLRRRDVDELALDLQERGYGVKPYHAGMTADDRRAVQDAFAAEKCDIVVATIAFGMGIDRSNLRFVLHATMPKSIEHYQQETGRAGRDGLEAECVLLHSAGDLWSWQRIVEKSASEPGVDPSFLPNALKHLDDIDRYCRGSVCRHRALVQYFGQRYTAPSRPADSPEPAGCGACDLCLGDMEPVKDALIVAQKILSCVARVKERFGAGQVISILRGEDTERVRKFTHDKLSTYGLLRDHDKADLRDWIAQLISQEVLVQNELTLPTGKAVPILGLNDASWEVMRGQRQVQLLRLARQQKGETAAKSKADTVNWEGVDRELFEALRELRRQLAADRDVPPYIVFSDATLREMAQVRPTARDKLRLIYGVGTAKLKDFGEQFLQVIGQHCRERGLTTDNAPGPLRSAEPPKSRVQLNPQRALAFRLFRAGAAIEDVMHQTGRARTTIMDYLGEFIREEKPESIRAWIADATYQRISQAGRRVGMDRLKPIYLELGEQVPYDEIRLVVMHLSVRASGRD